MNLSGATIFITGGAGFIGSHLAEHLIASGASVINYDLLTYAGNLNNIAVVSGHQAHTFVRGDIGDRTTVLQLLKKHRPRVIFNLAAESHVDRSIDAPEVFIDTNVRGVCRLLSAALRYWADLSGGEKQSFRFIHMSTDETYGSIAEGYFTEDSPYAPNSPYAASKAAGDQFVRAFRVTYGLPTLIARASNTYGPRQHAEKLIPHMVICAMSGKPLPVYGDGFNMRDWMYVGDLVRGLASVAVLGEPGQSYNFAAGDEWRNIETVKRICAHLDQRIPGARPHHEAISFVVDRPGHDARYAMSTDKVRRDLSWNPLVPFQQGLPLTLDWYLENRGWWQSILERGYSAGRVGLSVSPS
jgi:dTDP-glucose 4,6-dehydratase